MNSMVILTLISLIILAMGFLGIRLPFISADRGSNKISMYRKDSKIIRAEIPEFEDDPEIAYKVIKKQLKPQINIKRLKTLIPKHDEHLFRVRTLKRKVPGI